MTRGTMKYYLKIIREGYKDNSVFFGLPNFVMITLAGLFAFMLLVYEPANDWHETSFTLSRFEYRRVRGGAGLDLYTTDNRCYVLNHNDEEIRHKLKEGQQYNAVYSDNFFHDIIKGLTDAECEYLNADEMRKSHTTERFWFRVLLVLCVFLLLIFNSVYAISCVIAEEEKRRQSIRKSK